MTTNKYSDCTFRPAMKLNGEHPAHVVTSRTVYYFSGTLVFSTPATAHLCSAPNKLRCRGRRQSAECAGQKSIFFGFRQYPAQAPDMTRQLFWQGQKSRRWFFAACASSTLSWTTSLRVSAIFWATAIDRGTTARLSFARREARALQRHSCQTPA